MIEPTEYNSKPEFYKSTSPGNAKYSRFASTDVKSRIPKVVEIIEGSVTLNYQGKADFLIPLKYHNYAKQPLVIGFGKHPRGNVTKFPWEDTETFTNPVTQNFPLFCGVQKINQVSVQLVLNTDLTDDGINPPVYHWANKIYYYKFFVYNLP